MGQEDVGRAGDVSVSPFGGTANVEQLQTVPRRLKLMDRHLLQLAQWAARVLPGAHSTHQVTGELCVTGANKKLRDFFDIAIVFQHEKDRLLRVEQPSR